MGDTIDNLPVVTDYTEVAGFVAASTKTQGFDTRGYCLCGILTPANIAGTSLTFEGSNTLSGTYAPVKDGAGSSVSITITAGVAEAVNIEPKLLRAWRYLKVVSNAATNGDAGKALILSFVRI